MLDTRGRNGGVLYRGRVEIGLCKAVFEKKPVSVLTNVHSALTRFLWDPVILISQHVYSLNRVSGTLVPDFGTRDSGFGNLVGARERHEHRRVDHRPRLLLPRLKLSV